MLTYLVCLAVGVVLGGGLVVVFSKNNKNHIADARAEILDAVSKIQSHMKD